MLPALGRWIAAASLLVLLAGGLHQGTFARPLQVGAEVFAVDPGKVLEVSYRSSTLRMIAQRWEVGVPFTIIFLKQGQPAPRVCLAGPGFEYVLRQLTSLKLSRHLSVSQAKAYIEKNPLNSWAEMVIRDISQVEPFQARIIPVPGSAAEALVHFSGATYMVGLDAEVFQLISGGCKSLAAPGSHPK